MHTASSAKRTWSPLESAVEWTATVATSSSRQARMIRSAISPRFAIRIFLNTEIPTWLGRLDSEQRLSELNRLAVLNEDLGNLPADFRLDLVHQLHSLDDADHLALSDHRAQFHEGRLVGPRRPVEGADERRGHQVARLLRRRPRGSGPGSLGFGFRVFPPFHHRELGREGSRSHGGNSLNDGRRRLAAAEGQPLFASPPG